MTGPTTTRDVLTYHGERRRFLAHCASCPEHVDAEDVRLLVHLADEEVTKRLTAAHTTRTITVALVIALALLLTAGLIYEAMQ